jgi:predicted AlkP superfamily pyrophosphatase or phosphodiesterase
MRHLLVALVAILPSFVFAEEPPKPKLVVVLVFDQMRGDYLARWQPLFREDGFKRLQTQGAWFTDCHYPYASTMTGPGHASILSGTGPYKHGIITNEWYDRQSGEMVNCASSDRYQFVPALKANAPAEDDKPKTTTTASTASKPKTVGNPDKLMCETVADVLKAKTKGRAFGLSLKDRGALLPMGHNPDGGYWFVGQFLTSTYYRDSVPHWVSDFNKNGLAESYFGKDWVHFRNDIDYDKWAGPDDAPGEGKGVLQGGQFPHPTTGGVKSAIGKYYDAVATSPYGNELLLAFAKVCIDTEKLGQKESADLLTISFSANDLIGHSYGPDSHEVLDVTLRCDTIVADLLKHLDDKVGAGKYAVLVSADHGICPLPELSAKQGKDAKRISALGLIAGAEKHLRDTFGEPEPVKPGEASKMKARWIEGIAPPHIYLNHRLIAAKKLTVNEVTDTLAAYLRKQDGILNVYTAEKLTSPVEPKESDILTMVRKSFYPARSGDVYVVLKPLYLIGTTTTVERLATGTTHGSPHEYDTHVALIAYGPGVPGGSRSEKVTPLHMATIASWFLDIPKPKDAEYELPKSLLRK